ALETARDRVGALAGTEGVRPTEALRFDRATLRFGPDVLVAHRAVALAERVTADDQCDRLLVVHRHASKGLTDVPGGGERVRAPVRPLWVHIDQTHLHGANRMRELAFAAVPLVSEPRVLGTPEDLVGLPDVGSPETETERLEAHRFERAVAGEDDEI